MLLYMDMIVLPYQAFKELKKINIESSYFDLHSVSKDEYQVQIRILLIYR